MVTISPAYKNLSWYVIKRVYELSQDANSFNHEESDDLKFPSDAEVVCSIFCALLDYSTRGNKDIKHTHYFDNTVTKRQLELLKHNDLAILNTQPRQIYRAQFELIAC